MNQMQQMGMQMAQFPPCNTFNQQNMNVGTGTAINHGMTTAVKEGTGINYGQDNQNTYDYTQQMPMMMGMNGRRLMAMMPCNPMASHSEQQNMSIGTGTALNGQFAQTVAVEKGTGQNMLGAQ